MRLITLVGVIIGLLLFSPASSLAQKSRSPFDSGNRLYNPFHVEFKPAWNIQIDLPVRLIDVGPIVDPKRANLVFLVAGRDSADTQRRLQVLHWNGNHFDVDYEIASQSIGIDSLLIGRFYPSGAQPPGAPVKGASSSPAPPRPAGQPKGMQIMTQNGIYVWGGKGLDSLYAGQIPDVKQSVILEGRTEVLLVGAGDGTTPYEFEGPTLRPAGPLTLKGAGYTHFGIGTQNFPGSDSMNVVTGVRYAQSIWAGRTKWIIGLERGQGAPVDGDSNATTGDRLVVFTPKFPSRDKTFWETRADDLEQSWRSDPIPGRVLDVRIGDPKNDGKPGIMVLTAENNGKNRRLYFFVLSGIG